MGEQLLSVGIDIGTSTTQLIFSKLYIKNVASVSSVPRYEIAEKEIIYKSKIHFTPLKSKTEIDTEKAVEIIREEYKNAGIKVTDPDTGAVIITGETARKENARAVLDALSDFSGDFVVATAGADLESVLSGKGAGTDKISKEKHAVCLNFDIGGGTTNISVFNRGASVDTACFDIGGRLIKYDENRIITYITPKLKDIIERENLDISEGDKFSLEKVSRLLNIMTDVLCNVLSIKKSPYYSHFITNKGLTTPIKPDYITFSGGVAKAIYEAEENPFAYGDIGVFLAEKIKNSEIFEQFNVLKGNETIRATVVGAGSHTTEVSGSTIYFDKSVLPVKSLPILKIENETDFLNEFNSKISRFDLERPFAIALNGKKGISFDEVKKLANSVSLSLKNLTTPIFIIFKNDMAKAFGYVLQGLCPDKKLVVIDGITLKEEDFIDIGKPASSNFLPVVVKTLLFQ